MQTMAIYMCDRTEYAGVLMLTMGGKPQNHRIRIKEAPLSLRLLVYIHGLFFSMNKYAADEIIRSTV